MPSFSSMEAPPAVWKTTFKSPLPGYRLALSMLRVAAVVPSTSGWLEATNTLMVPSSASTCVVCR